MEENKQQNTEDLVITADQTVIYDGNEDEHQYHSEHSHHIHHHHHRRKKSKNNKLISFLKKNSSITINILSCTVSIVLICMMAINIDFSRWDEAENNRTALTQSTIRIETSIFPKKILLVSDAVSYYINSDNDDSVNDVYKSFSGSENLLNAGLPLNFAYYVSGLPSNIAVRSATLEISEKSDYVDVLTYKLDMASNSLDIYNLKTGTKYYYRLNLVLNDDCIVGTTGSFETEKSPRILNIEGVVNARDIGGWTTSKGKTIRQGLLFRGSEIDGAVVTEYDVTDRGIQQMIGELGVRYDMDLRSPSDIVNFNSALGKNVRHKFYAIGQYADILNDYNRSKISEIFHDLANKDNYPMYVHCTYGRDRTGTVLYLLGALLGMTDEDLNSEYELSAFTYSAVDEREFQKLKDEIGKLNGDTTQQKVEGYLLSRGVTAEDIATIREIFLEG